MPNDLTHKQPKVDQGREKKAILVELGRDVWMKPSIREMFLADEWLKGFNYSACSRAFEVKFKRPLSSVAVQRWLGRSRVKHYMEYRLKQEGVFNAYSGPEGKKRWLLEIMEMREGIRPCNKASLQIMEMVGRYMGYMENNSISVKGENIQFNFLQANGEK